MTNATTQGPAKRATRRARLDAETIVAAGIDLAAKPGVSAISVRDLGAQLGADPTAIYRHFRSKESLMEALLDALTERALERITADPADWQERLRQLAGRTLELFAEHPAIGVEATVLTTHGTGELAAIEFMLEAFTRAGLTGDELVRHYALFASQVLTGAAGIANGRTSRGTGDGSTRWFDGPLAADPARFPLVASVLTELAQLEDHVVYEIGVENIIASAERTAAGRGASHESGDADTTAYPG